MGKIALVNYPENYLNLKLPNVNTKGNYVLIEITNKITGWTIAKIYGSGTVKALAIETYETIVYYINSSNEKKKLTTFNLTRDGFYDLGIDPKTKKSKIVNRASEPLNNVTVRATATVDYADTYGAYALDPFHVEELPKEWNYFTNGLEIPKTVKRKSSKMAEDVMIHIGGYYTKRKGTKYKIGGTYGCYGVIAKSMVFLTWKEANDIAKQAIKVIDDPKNVTPLSKGVSSNKEQNRLVNTVNSAIKKHGNSKTEIYVHIQKNPSRRKEIK